MTRKIKKRNFIIPLLKKFSKQVITSPAPVEEEAVEPPVEHF